MSIQQVSEHRACRARIVIRAACLLILGAMVAGCGNKVQTATVERRDVVAHDEVNGKVVAPPSAQANIKPPFQAPVQKIDVQVGQLVQAGDVLMEMQSPTADVYYKEARQRLLDAKQEAQQARQRYNSQVQQAQKNLQQAQSAEQQASQAAQQPTATAQDQQQLQQATQNLQQAQQALEVAQETMTRGMVGYQQQLASAQQEFQDAQTGKKLAMVRTPISGTVTQINVQTGDTVSPDQKKPVAVVTDLSALEVQGAISKDETTRIKRGDPATIDIPDVPSTLFSGLVEHVLPGNVGLIGNADYVAVLSFRNPGGKARPGMPANASVQIDEEDNVLAVPNSAVYDSNGMEAVKVRRNNQWQEQIVQTGLIGDQYTEIKSGLTLGEEVQTNPS